MRRAALLLLALASPRLAAHELGVVQVQVVFSKDATYRVDLAADIEHLPPSLPEQTGDPARTRYGAIAGLPAEISSRHRAFLAGFLDQSRLAFDGRDDLPRVVYLGTEGPLVLLRLTGDVPREARAVTWWSGLPLGAYLLSVSFQGVDEPVRQWLESGKECVPVPLDGRVVPPSRLALVKQYLALGFTHILPLGIDHVLFVVGLFLLSHRLRPLLVQVTCFTVAHTLTLGVTLLGLVSVPPRVVEPMIALSIAYVAFENVLAREMTPWRPALVFGFGLLHGMGFAGVLKEVGLPRRELLTGLVTFNVGVELGQLTVLLAAFLVVGLPFRRKTWYRPAIVVPASLAIGALGLYWTAQRFLAG